MHGEKKISLIIFVTSVVPIFLHYLLRYSDTSCTSRISIESSRLLATSDDFCGTKRRLVGPGCELRLLPFGEANTLYCPFQFDS